MLRPFIIDCDTGRDDALTLWLAVTTGLPLKGVVTSYGNASLAKVTDNTARVLSLVGGDQIPIFAGLERPETMHRLFAPVIAARQQSSGNGICNLEFPISKRPTVAPCTPSDIAESLREIAGSAGALDYFIIGPPTNFTAIAQLLGKDLYKTVARVTMMGGKFEPLWSEIPGPDFNIAGDPYALDAMMKLELPIRFLPMNATWPIYITLPEIENLRPTNELAQWAQQLMIAHCRYFAPEPVFRFHDPSILLAAQQPQFFAPRRLALICDETSKDFGRLIETSNGVDCLVYETKPDLYISFRETILKTLGFET